MDTEEKSTNSAPVPGPFEVTEADRQAFAQHLRSFVPPKVFDTHGHIYRCADGQGLEVIRRGPAVVDLATYRQEIGKWMGDRAPRAGLFFPTPFPKVDVDAANDFLANDLLGADRRLPYASAALMLLRPQDDPNVVEARLNREPWSGFKVYHIYANRSDTMFADTSEFLPEWVWELADARSLAIMLHMVRPRAMADPDNQRYIIDHCRRYPQAKLILAHSARSFCGHHNVESVDVLRGLDNVWFENSATCEPEAMAILLQRWGVSRCCFGADFPVCQFRGKCVSIGDSFHWLDQQNTDWSSSYGPPRLVGHESLLGLRDACRLARCSDADIEAIFWHNPRRMLGLEQPPAAGEGKGEKLYEEAKRQIPGGVQLLSKRPECFAPAKWPAYASEAHGVEVVDLDGRRYLDMSQCGIGSCLLGYNHPRVTDAVIRRIQLGSMSTLNSPDEVEVTRRLLERHPWATQARYTRSGGEAMAVAVRIARAATRRDIVAICGYHGWSDWYLAANLGEADALGGHLLPGLSPAGVPRSLAGTILPFRYNQLDELTAIISKHGQRLAAVVMEPTRTVDPAPGFLEGVRDACSQCGAAMVFDEITTGFRFYPGGGAHLRYGVEPDIAVYAKALGNGHPIGAIIGRNQMMQAAQESFISSTYWTEGVGFAAALATLDVMKECDVPQHVAKMGEQFKAGVAELARRCCVPLIASGHPSLASIRVDHPDADALMTLFITRLLDHRVLAGSAFYPTLAHEPRHVERYLHAAEAVLPELAEAADRGDSVDRLGGQAYVRQTGFARLT
ncbi:aminotransferase class III-fold pyridoxal phosphate-dependent enzyme [Phycisphaerales bacterium AB-hyl4]|uniref:Aminotransferase class III-fold pyridoxal phosphate-dependent enzyme n=1 Tax=Natronomicrosphaera hydrolytica TaxID=3242702 RepID=A0ABV4U9L4_9BACT